MLSSTTSTTLIQQTKCVYASQSHWHQILWKRFKDPLLASGMTSLQMKVTKGSLWLRTVADCKEQTRCLSSLAILSKESLMVSRAQTLPTAQHELHCRSLLRSILPNSAAPGFCRVSGRCRGGPRLMVCTNLGVLKRSDFICPHSKQLFIFLPGLSNDKGNTSCQITEGIAWNKKSPPGVSWFSKPLLKMSNIP